jgi:hypothetical protein
MPERIEFGKIELVGDGKLKLTSKGVNSIVEGRVDIKDGGKKKKINPILLSNLRSLAIRAQGPFGDSSDENAYNQEIIKLKEKFPKEQPEEVWGKTLATMMRDGADIKGIAEALLEVSMQYRLSQRIGDISFELRQSELKKLHETIAEYWPKHK